MAEKQFNTRIQLKGDILENWKKATGFIPKENEFLLVTDTGGTLRGDGVTSAAVLAGINGEPTQYFQMPTSDIISVDDIDTICSATIQDTTKAEVTF